MNFIRNPTHLTLKPQQNLSFSLQILHTFTTSPPSQLDSETNRITKLINDHPFPSSPLHPTLLHTISPSLLSTPLIENILGRLFSSHSNGLKAVEFFKFSLLHSHLYTPTPDSFEKTLHILTRMRHFNKALQLMKEIQKSHVSLLTHKSMSIVLSRVAKFRSFEDTLQVFDEMEKEIYVKKPFGVKEFNVLLRAFCTQRQMKEAKAVFRKIYLRFSPNTQTLNILLLGFKESGNITAFELFYHEMIRRGFKPNVVTYGIRIDAYCKKGSFGDGLRIFEEMERENCAPTLEIITTLIHGAGIARNLLRARDLFDEISVRNLCPDTGAYNALMGSFIKVRDVKSAMGLMDEMEEKGIEHDNVTYHTLFLGLKKTEGIVGVIKLYQKMVERNFIPKSYTVVMLMKNFCENRRPDLGLELWNYLVDSGCCPHEHALDVLIIGLCCRGQVNAAYECAKQMVERGRHLSKGGFSTLQRFLLETGESDKLSKLDEMLKRLQTVLPPSRGHTLGLPASTTEN